MSNPVHPALEPIQAEVERVALQVTTGTSDCFVPAPKKDEVLSDLFVGLKRFSNTVRWKEFFLRKAQESDTETNTVSSDDDDHDTKGLSTNLKPSHPKAAP